jgi:response regulator RpfG family c-di-GMP phosphodiesterase
MHSFLSKLKLFHKISLGFYLFLLITTLLVATFYNVSNMMMTEIQKNHENQTMIKEANEAISQSLKKLDSLSIRNSLEDIQDYDKKVNKIYQNIIDNITLLQNDAFFAKNSNVKTLLKQILFRVYGYKNISKMLKDDMQESIEDGVYSILALTNTSSIIAKELKLISNEIDIKSNKDAKLLNDKLMYIRIGVLFTISIFIILMTVLNKEIVNSITRDLNKLHKMISSFFMYLSKKSDTVEHISFDSNDEIANIAKVIDSNIYLAEEILKKERKETSYIQNKIDEAIKEIKILNNEIESTQREVVFTMGAIAEERSRETSNHVKRVAEYSLILARLYGLSPEESILLKNASPMHDIGKIAIADAILNKPGKFIDEEFKIMQSHAELGYRMLKHSNRSILKAAAIVAYEHHEKYDGTGYPRGIKGDDIHIYGRITAIADVFDALGSERVYKKAWPIEKILDLFEQERAKHFDPKLVDIFIDNLAHFLAAKENIDSMGDNSSLSRYIEDFEKHAKEYKKI